MKSPMRYLLACGAIAALTLTGCGVLSGGGESSPEGAGGDPVNGGKVEAGKSKPRKTIASQDVTVQGADLHFAVHDLARRGKTVELTFSVSNTGKKEIELGTAFIDGNVLSDDRGTIAGVKLIDPGNGKVHLVARDSQKRCVCTGPKYGEPLEGGDSILMSGTYGAPPKDVEEMNVSIPKAGTLNDVPLS
ncbi:hypothetical protein CLV63_101519 [Murinocardiopsis flavida]|uniref:Lipoprotein n=1 Tax=Murinocardiopsis flavida TaxID=645275 RepID=A0A2P8DV05_9ACTN|nr:hypothetical protein [Murinocardiopsis flavida]PSL01040.1 hypothetical protein CLV63_101519 [Murinocardiopsis flavida]